jgi:hypothetical protein
LQFTASIDEREVLKKAILMKNAGIDISTPTAQKTLANIY